MSHPGAISLRARLSHRWHAEPFLVRVGDTQGPATVCPSRGGEGLELWNGDVTVRLPKELAYLATGDVLRVVPATGEVQTLYRKASAHNFIFLTGQCNSFCVMCSQPPTSRDDSHLDDVWCGAVPLMDPETTEIGITGGEPTLHPERLLRVVAACRTFLPRTSLHLLSNGRMFSYLSLASALAEVGHPDLMVGIPIYSDIPSVHDFVVQAPRSFDQTLRGVMNLLRCEVPVEIRVVVHAGTVDRLAGVCRFIAQNLRPVTQVAIMGLEQVGFGKANLEDLWVDPADYVDTLESAVGHLVQGGVPVAIYNHQLCTLPRALHRYARTSISDWKRTYIEECTGCALREQCGGFFASSTEKRSRIVGAWPR